MAILHEVTTPAADGTLAIPEGWRQGRGAYGGLTIAAAIRAIEQRVADPRRQVRTVTAEIPAPTLPGTAQITVDILRSGNSVTVARAALAQAGEVTTHAVAVLAAPREIPESPTWCDLEPPEVAPWQSLPALPETMPGPEFARHFEYRMVAGVPFTGVAPQVIGWVRPRDLAGPRDAAYLAALADAWYPGTLVRAKGPRPIATIAYTLEIVEPLGDADRDAPLLYRGTVPVARGGYFLETRELWTADGRLLALNHQTFAVIQ